MNYYGLHNLDKMLLEYINFNNGFFIEAGANNGVHQSNTLVFEQRYGWKGLLIEPNYQNYKRCIINRPNSIVEHCALVSNDYSSDYIEGNFINLSNFNGESLMQGVTEKHLKNSNRTIKVIAKTLQSILNFHNINHVDFFSLDVEGYEIEVLNGLDFNKISPTYMLIETGTEDLQIKCIIDYMIDKKYETVDRLSKNDFLFKLKQ